MKKVWDLLLNNKKFLGQNLISYIIILLNILISVFSVREIIGVIGKEQYGLWILIVGINGFLILTNFGYNSTFVFNFATYCTNNTKAKIISTNFVIVFMQFFIVFFLCILITCFSSYLINDEVYVPLFKKLLWFSFPGILFYITATYFESVLYYHYSKISSRQILEFIRLGGVNLLYVFFLAKFNNIIFIPICYSLVAFVTVLYSIVVFVKLTKFKVAVDNIEFKYVFDNFKNSFSYWLLGFSAFVISQTDSLFISLLINDLGVITIYSQSFRLQDVAVKFIKKITEIKSPKILKLYNEGDFKSVVDVYYKLIYLNLIVGFGAALVIIFLGKLILIAWLGDFLSFNQNLLIAISVLCVTSPLHWVLWNFCTITNLQVRLRRIVIVEILLNIVLSFYLMKIFGLVGLPVASIISNSFTIIVMVKFFNDFVKVKIN